MIGTGDEPLLIANTFLTNGASMEVVETTKGSLPLNFKTVDVQVGSSPMTSILSGLTLSQTYFVRILAANDLGYGDAQFATSPAAFLAPQRRPDQPSHVELYSHSSDKLEVLFREDT